MWIIIVGVVLLCVFIGTEFYLVHALKPPRVKRSRHVSQFKLTKQVCCAPREAARWPNLHRDNCSYCCVKSGHSRDGHAKWSYWWTQFVETGSVDAQSRMLRYVTLENPPDALSC